MYNNLYTFIVLDFSTIFSSRARFRVLRTLHHQTVPLCLRHIAYLSGVPLYSAQRVLQQLVHEKLLIRKIKGSYVLFFPNWQNTHAPFLAQLFELEMKTQIASMSNDYHRRAKSTLHFFSFGTSCYQRSQGMDFKKFFIKVVKILQREKVRYALAGGLVASLYRREERLTKDLDFLIFSESKSLEKATQIIRSLGLKSHVIRKADLEGGPLFAIKRKNRPP